jgi:hypothetical protein
MRMLTLYAIVVSVMICFRMDAKAQTWSKGPVAAYHYVGPSGIITSGSTGGIPSMNALCQDQYGPTAHMCTSTEYFNTSGTPAGKTTQTKWIQPVGHDCYCPQGNACPVCFYDGWGWGAPGPDFSSPFPTCLNWASNSPSENGTAVVGSKLWPGGSLSWSSCNEYHPVACCAP